MARVVYGIHYMVQKKDSYSTGPCDLCYYNVGTFNVISFVSLTLIHMWKCGTCESKFIHSIVLKRLHQLVFFFAFFTEQSNILPYAIFSFYKSNQRCSCTRVDKERSLRLLGQITTHVKDIGRVPNKDQSVIKDTGCAPNKGPIDHSLVGWIHQSAQELLISSMAC